MLVSAALEKIANFADSEDAAPFLGMSPGRRTIGELRVALLKAAPNDLVQPTANGDDFEFVSGPGS
ncbi:hypothetical protein [Silvibacterium acidisoli]|uniref:hypothetical protein n=1 Tax=Acidobacteriaceae bacterium ZG23-2 TaxID=2883246 RepID=UPI00406C281A